MLNVCGCGCVCGWAGVGLWEPACALSDAVRVHERDELREEVRGRGAPLLHLRQSGHEPLPCIAQKHMCVRVHVCVYARALVGDCLLSTMRCMCVSVWHIRE